MEIFVAKIEELAAVRLNLNLLTDKSVMKLAEKLSLTQKNVKEYQAMENLNQAAGYLAEQTAKNVRIVCLPPATVVVASYANIDAKDDKPYQERAMVVKNAMKKFIDDVDLFTIKPDTRFFGELYHEGHYEGNYVLWATIPDDLEVPAPLYKFKFDGGLYAVCKGEEGLWDWLGNSGDYYWQPGGGENRPITHEYINIYNRHNLKHGYDKDLGFSFLELMIPIKEITTFTDEEKEAICKAIAEAEARGKITEVDLSSLANNDNLEVNFTDGLAVIKSANDAHTLRTTQEFSIPLKVEMRAATDSADIVLDAGGRFMFNHRYMPDMIAIFDSVDGDVSFHDAVAISPNEFVDIEVILGKQAIIIKINGKIQYFDGNDKYIAAFRENPAYTLSVAVGVGAAYGSTVTIESLRITEL